MHRNGKIDTQVCTLRELQSGDELLPANTVLRVIMQNDEGVRGVDSQGGIHVVKPLDYEAVPEVEEHNGAEIFLR